MTVVQIDILCVLCRDSARQAASININFHAIITMKHPQLKVHLGDNRYAWNQTRPVGHDQLFRSLSIARGPE